MYRQPELIKSCMALAILASGLCFQGHAFSQQTTASETDPDAKASTREAEAAAQPSKLPTLAASNSPSTTLEAARIAASQGQWRTALDVARALLVADPFDFEARQLLADAYEQLGYKDYAAKTREGFYDHGLGAFRDLLGHGGRSASFLARRPVEGLKIYARAGVGSDSNPAYAPADFAAAYQKSFGTTPGNNVLNTKASSSAYLALGLGGEYYVPLSPTYGVYLNADFGGAKYFAAQTSNNQSVSWGLGLARYDDISGLRIGVRALNGRFGAGIGSSTNSPFNTIGIGVDFGRQFGAGWSASMGLGLDRAHYSDSPAADFSRASIYAGVTKAWATPLRPSVQLMLSSVQDRRRSDSFTGTGIVTGPDRHENGITLAAQFRPHASWTVMASVGLARRSDDSPNWSSGIVPFSHQTRVLSSVSASYRLTDLCSLQGRLGNAHATSDVPLYAYDKLDLYLGVSCWLK